jgi:hypothetical protein
LAYVYDLFSNSKEGFEEHFQIETADIVGLIADRKTLIAGILEDGATPRAQTSKFNKTATGAAPMSPMEQGATKVFGPAAVSVECANGCGPMKFVPSGISRNTNKPYPSFYSCKTCGAKQNAPKA